MSNVGEKLKAAAFNLEASGILQPRREAASLMAFALRKDKTFLVAHPDYELSSEEEKRIEEFVRRRADREPFQYITGKQEFYGLDFLVTKDVLIPRPETELIVENAIEVLREIEKPAVCEVGVGSGCISIAILREVEKARVIGLDISPKALKIAEKNAFVHRVAERLELKVSDVFASLGEEVFDLIVSNPPYVPSKDIEALQREVRDFEPLSSLTDGADGYSIIERLVRDAPKFLKKNAFLLMEIGFNQSENVRKMFPRATWKQVDILPDLQGIPRMVKALKSG